MANDNCNFGMLSSDDVRTGFISGVTFKNKPVQYAVVDGLAVFEGCIVLGTVAQMEARQEALRSGNAAQYPNYVHFRPATGCRSSVGMQGGKQDIGLANGCSTGNAIHEIGHALGLWHEQSREDRDQHIVVHWQNMESGKEHNFNQHVTDGDDYAPYDFGSVMHYPGLAFSKNGQPTITTINAIYHMAQKQGGAADLQYLPFQKCLGPHSGFGLAQDTHQCD